MGFYMNVTPLEKYECEVFAQWLTMKGYKFSHLSNEANNVKAIARNERIGVRSGVPDFLVIIPEGLVFIEMKRKKNSHTSIEQKEWIKALNKCVGVEAQVCYGADMAIDFINKFS